MFSMACFLLDNIDKSTNQFEASVKEKPEIPCGARGRPIRIFRLFPFELIFDH